MPEWLWLAAAAAAITWSAAVFQLVMVLCNWRLSRRVQRLQQRIARDLAEVEPYRPIIAAIQEHDAECAAYQATQIVLGLFAMRVGAPITFGE